MPRRTIPATAVAAALAAAAAPVGAQGDPPPRAAMEWLQNEPVSLLDWGMMRLQRDLDQAASHVARTYLRAPVPRLGVYYRFADRRIVAYMTLVDVPRNRTAEACRDVYARVVGRMTMGAPQGAGGAGWYLESLFSHDHRRGGRPENLGAELLDRVVMQVTIGPTPEEAAHGDSRRITCSGRLDAAAEDIALKSEG